MLPVALAVAGIVAVAALVVPLGGRSSLAVALAALATVAGTLLAAPGAAFRLGEVTLVLDAGTGRWLAAVAVACGCVAVLDALDERSSRAGPLTVLFVVGTVLALAAPAVPARVLLAATSGLAAAAILAQRSARSPHLGTIAVRDVAAAAALLAAGSALLGGPLALAGAVPAFGVALTVAGAALALGVPPLHGRPLRIAAAAAAWTPVAVTMPAAVLVLAALPALDGAVASGASVLAAALRIWAAVAVVAAGAAALTTRSPVRAIAWAGTIEAAFLLLGLPPGDAGAEVAVRDRLVVLPLALAAGWTAIASVRVGRQVGSGSAPHPDPGWGWKAPASAVALLLAPIALYGWPGSAAWDARIVIGEQAAGPALGSVAALAAAAPFVVAVLRFLADAFAGRPERERAPGRQQARRTGTWRPWIAGATAVVVGILALAVAAGAAGLRPG